MQKTPYESLHQPLDCLGAVAKDDADEAPVSESDFLSRLFMLRAGLTTASSSENKIQQLNKLSF